MLSAYSLEGLEDPSRGLVKGRQMLLLYPGPGTVMLKDDEICLGCVGKLGLEKFNLWRSRDGSD